MRFGIISDDLTGANDSGVQLARYGLKTSVRFDLNEPLNNSDEAIVLDTDSRSISQEQAYKKVKECAQFLQQHDINIVYKKIDSTLRGNIGVEIDAVFDVTKPQFVVIAPGYPKNGRKVINGYHYLNDEMLHVTEIAKDPKSPVTESYIPRLIQQQTSKKIGHIDLSILTSGYDNVKSKLDEFYSNDIAYVLFDSETEDHLKLIANYMYTSNYSVVWLGSAGLANYLPDVYGINKEKPSLSIDKNNHPILLVAGSVSSVTRKQLDLFLSYHKVKGVKLDSTSLVSKKTRDNEIASALQKAKMYYDQGYHIALYSSGETDDIVKAQAEGEKNGFDKTEVSNQIVHALGELTNDLLETKSFQGIILTGGDTAKQVCKHINVVGIELSEEVETGVPIGKLLGRHSMYAVTKAGAFGTENTFIKSMKILQGIKEQSV
jgi:uncharacterized protein YgbK (DUF1537 family)